MAVGTTAAILAISMMPKTCAYCQQMRGSEQKFCSYCGAEKTLPMNVKIAGDGK